MVVSLGPEGILVPVPNVVGMPLTQAQELLRESHLVVSEVKTRHSDAPPEEVIEQSIEAETEVDANSAITITISLGSASDPWEDDPVQDPIDQPIQIPGIDDPEVIGEASVSFRLPSDEDSAHVVVYVDGNQVHEQIYDTSEHRRVSLDLTAAAGDRMVYIDINGERDERIVKFR